MIWIPRVARRGEASRLGGRRGGQLGHVGAAQRDEAGGPELLGEVGGDRPGHLTQRPQAERGGLTRDRAAHVLVQDRHAAERAVGQVAVGLPSRRLEPGPDHGIQPRIDRLDPGDGSLGQLLGAHLAAAHQISLCDGIQPCRFGRAARGLAADLDDVVLGVPGHGGHPSWAGRMFWLKRNRLPGS
jgi:hypothetical protein